MLKLQSSADLDYQRIPQVQWQRCLQKQKTIKNEYAKTHRYGDIKGKFKNLKISTVAMIPYKSKAFRTILDLLFRIWHEGNTMQSVKLATAKQHGRNGEMCPTPHCTSV